MHIVYWAHSYRNEDADVNRHFGTLIEQAEEMVVNFDPPSQSVSEAKLQHNRRSCDGMVAVLTWRATGPSKYILFEIELALRARMPVVVFVDGRLPSNLLPPRVLQQRFSHRTYFRQMREHRHALRILKDYMGNPPPVRYQANFSQRCCAVVGWERLDSSRRTAAADLALQRGYRLLDLDTIDRGNPLSFEQDEALAAADVALIDVDAQASASAYWMGALAASGVPSITFTTNAKYAYCDDWPREFQPGAVDQPGSFSLEEFLVGQFDLFEQEFLSAKDGAAIENYVKMQVEAGALEGRYEAGTRNTFIRAIMNNQYNNYGQAGAFGENAQSHGTTFTQGANAAGSVDLAALAAELERLKHAVTAEASKPEEFAAMGSVAAAEAAARDGDGAKVYEYLKAAGKWTLAIAEKIGVGIAKDAIEKAFKGG